MSVSSDRDRLMDLLADRTLVGLEASENEELARLLVDFPDTEQLSCEIELAAAAIAIAAVSERGLLPMPRELFAKIDEGALDGMPTTIQRLPAAALRAASASVPASLKATVQMPGSPSVPPPVPAAGVRTSAPHAKTLVIAPPPEPHAWSPSQLQQVQPQQPPQQHHPQLSHPPPSHAVRPVASIEQQRARSGRGVAIAGWLAAAACLLLAAGTWYLRPRTQIVTVSVPAPPPSAIPSAAPPPLTATAERESLLARAGTAKLEWSKTKDPASKQATGDVVWNAAEQRGYMRFRGLAKNDRRANVYQLWIFDKTRDDKYPVDGGVFEIEDETGDVVVPIKARLPVGEIALFAVTVEKPGGVVVSKRERIVVMAKPST